MATINIYGRSFLAATILLALLSIFYPSSAVGGDTEAIGLFVSPEGNDTWSGRFPRVNAQKTDGPLASFAGARDAIRGLRGKTGELKRPVRVNFADGTYHVGETILFTPIDSGTKACPVTYRAAPGAKVVISGARVISG